MQSGKCQRFDTIDVDFFLGMVGNKLNGNAKALLFGKDRAITFLINLNLFIKRQ